MRPLLELDRGRYTPPMGQAKIGKGIRVRRPAPPVQPKLLPINGACQALGVSRSMVYRLIREGRLRSVMLGSRRMIPMDAIDELLLQLHWQSA